jgi:hypothetical protein
VFLVNRDLRWAIDCGKLLVDPRPEVFGAGYDANSLDLHLGSLSRASVWNVEKLRQENAALGISGPELPLGSFDFVQFATNYLTDIPVESEDAGTRDRQLVCRRGHQVIVKPGGFLLWNTKEKVGRRNTTPS